MTMKNKIKDFLDSRGVTPYQFWKQTEVAQRTAYDLYNNPEQYPSRDVMDKICSTYGIQPGQILEWVESAEVGGND
jgi:DNA-binding Xre family transcriptional regulator